MYILSDFQRSSWGDVVFESLPEKVRLFFVDTTAGERDRPNTSISRVTLGTGVVSAKEQVKLAINVANFSPTPVTIPLEALVDGRLATPGEISLAPWSTGTTSITVTAPGAGLHGIEIRSPEDGLPADNHRWARIEVQERESVLILTDAVADDSGVQFIEAALDPYDGKQGGFSLRTVTRRTVTPQQIGAASRIVLTGANSLPDETMQRLVSFMQQGGGILWFLNSTADAENLQRFDSLLGGGNVSL